MANRPGFSRLVKAFCDKWLGQVEEQKEIDLLFAKASLAAFSANQSTFNRFCHFFIIFSLLPALSLASDPRVVKTEAAGSKLATIPDPPSSNPRTPLHDTYAIGSTTWNAVRNPSNGSDYYVYTGKAQSASQRCVQEDFYAVYNPGLVTTIIDKSQDSAAWLFTAPINFIFNTLAKDTERGMRPGLYLASTPAEVLPLGCYWNENGEVEYVNNQHEDEESRSVGVDDEIQGIHPQSIVAHSNVAERIWYRVRYASEQANRLTKPSQRQCHQPTRNSRGLGYITAGLLSFNYTADSANQTVGVAFSESSYYATRSSDMSIGLNGEVDGSLRVELNGTNGTQEQWTADDLHLRGAYRYATLFMATPGTVEVSGLSNQFTAAPQVDEDKLREYSGYFYSDDALLNRIWYAAAYTNQLSTIGAGTSRNTTTTPTSNWNNSELITPLSPSDSVLVDGAKRDRTEWPGDFATAIPPTFLANNRDGLGMEALRNSLRALYSQVSADGMLPYAGPPLLKGPQSYTYHLWTLSATYAYWKHSGDDDFVKGLWDVFSRGVDLALEDVERGANKTGLLDVPESASSSWGRSPTAGHDLTANANLTDEAMQWEEHMEPLSNAINTHLWDEETGLYMDNDTEAGHSLYPQDGNAVAVLYGVADADRAQTVSSALKQRWNDHGAVSPEGLSAISPFVSGLEVSAHVQAGNITNALELIRLEWGYMLSAFSNSTLIEGFYHDGTLHYPFYGSLDSYISHAHAWSTTPLATLTQEVAGLRIGDNLTRWEYAPQNTDLEFVETGFAVQGGEIRARMRGGGGVVAYELQAPQGTSGSIRVPVADNGTVSVDGKRANGERGNGKMLLDDIQGNGQVMEIVVADMGNFAANWSKQTDPTREESDAFA
ncbi:hypothetical protein E3P81_03603 [Wallemia ichthyophaga]|nr:hypothetical protein E3P97_02358 [Wallemia ichthyophaga]TIB28865.1 hypothetical protein E3P85_03458 [Wallemia ichthyophaga]TIB44246.1 hypothetical protein E3P82_03608 [Wallemia ichthyophaga]TIB46613.1 hypothetical protein E3P81_03603 [Wallemia ichthyophaga]TIB49243.1 hypothetical protein E3P80_03612 [Wallemia ichthyophaga]